MLTFALMTRFRLSYALLFLTLFLLSCRDKRTENIKPQLTVSILPQKYLADYIAGDKYDVQVMLPTGSNHETYEPAPRDMEKIASSEFYFALGALDFELTWMDRFKASAPKMKVVNTSEGISMLSGHVHNDETEHHQTGHGIDPHIWLSPACMKIQAFNICKALSDADTANSAFYGSNLVKFNQLADSVDKIIRLKLIGAEGKTFIIFHPALGYFARDYNLNQISIEQEGKEPSPAMLEELIKTARQMGIKSVLISKEFDTRNAEAIAREIKGKVVIFDPMDINWAENMVNLATLIADNQ